MTEPGESIRSRTATETSSAEHEVEAEAAEVHEPQPNGWVAQLRQIMQRSPQGAARTNIKRQQLKEDRTKSFLLLAGLTVVLSLAFFAMFSTPNSRKNIARADHPNLGRAQNAENPDTSHSVTPLLSADTRRPDDDAGSLSPDDIRNTAKQRTLAQARPSFGTPPETPPEAPRPEAKDYALNRIQFPAETPEQTPPPSPVPSTEKPTKASLVFVSATSGTRGSSPAGSNVQPAMAERNWEFMVLPAGTRLVARLQTPVSSAVKTPVVAAIEYNYERDGEVVIPAGSKAFGELSQVNEQGYVGIQFHSIQLPDETTQKIEGHAVGLQYQPLRGDVTGRNTGKRFLVRSLAGVGTILAATVGVQTGSGITESFSIRPAAGAGRKQCGERGTTATERPGLSPKHRSDSAGQHTVLYRVGEARQRASAGAGPGKSGSYQQSGRYSGLRNRLHAECTRIAGVAGIATGANTDVSAAAEEPSRTTPPDQQ